MITEKGTIVITFDDVIAYNSYDLYKYLCINYDTYGTYLDIFKMKSRKDFYMRDNINVLDSLFKKETYNKLNNDSKLLTLTSILCNIYVDYYSIKSIYPSNSITKLTKSGLNNPLFKNNSGIQKIVIIIDYKTDSEKIRKTNLINTIFENSVIIEYCKKREYYEVIANKYKNWDLLITDDIDCVEKLSSRNIDHKEFLLPKYGYNIAKPELVELIKQKSGSLSYYEIDN